MGKLRYFAFSVSIVFIASLSAQAEEDFSYEKNTFINYWSCLGIYPGTSLSPEERVWLFSMDQSPISGKVSRAIRAAEAQKKFDALGFNKAYDDKPLWAEIGCVHSFRGDMPESLARVAPEPKESSTIGFAIRGLPDGAWIAGGKGDSVVLDVIGNPYLEAVRHLVTDACYASDSLIRLRQFPINGKGSAIVQLDIGKVKKVSAEKKKQNIEKEMRRVEESYHKWEWPEAKRKRLEQWKRKDLVESVEICRFFMNKNRVLKAEKISRNTDVDERVDTRRIMDTDNWANTTTSAIGFVSLNEGKDWDALFVDVGFEGINYSIERLNGSAVLFSRSLYTYH